MPNGQVARYIVSALAGALLMVAAAHLIQPAPHNTAPAAPPTSRRSIQHERLQVAGCTSAEIAFANRVWRELRDRGMREMFAEVEDSAAALSVDELGAFTSSDALEQFRRGARVLPCAEPQEARALGQRFQAFVDRVDTGRAALRGSR